MMLSSLLFRLKNKDNNNAADMQTPKPPPPTSTSLPLGLKTLTLPPEPTHNRHCLGRAFSSLSLPPSPVGETEEEEEEEEAAGNGCMGLYGWRRTPCMFPPAIPLLARTANLTCHMPWVLKRTYKDDGSLVIQQIPVKHHEYFKASRGGGRLTLQHMYLNTQSPLYITRPKPQNEDEMITEEDNEAILLLASPAPSSGFLDAEEDMDVRVGGKRGGDSETQLEKTQRSVSEDVLYSRSKTPPRFARSPLMELSSSMPEPVFPVRNGCFQNGEPGLLPQVPKMRAVQG